MTQIERCLERAAFTEAVAERMSIGEQRQVLLEIAAQWRRMAEEAKAKASPVVSRVGSLSSPSGRTIKRVANADAVTVDELPAHPAVEQQKDDADRRESQSGRTHRRLAASRPRNRPHLRARQGGDGRLFP